MTLYSALQSLALAGLSGFLWSTCATGWRLRARHPRAQRRRHGGLADCGPGARPAERPFRQPPVHAAAGFGQLGVIVVWLASAMGWLPLGVYALGALYF